MDVVFIGSCTNARISDLRDESDRDGVRVVIELKRDATAEVVLNQLFRFTPMQSTFGANMLALNGGRPEQLTLRDFLTYFLAFREEVIARVLVQMVKAQPALLETLAPELDVDWDAVRGSVGVEQPQPLLLGQFGPGEDLVDHLLAGLPRPVDRVVVVSQPVKD